MNINLKPFAHREHDFFIDNLLDFKTVDILTFSGAYIFVSFNQKFIYPNGQSRVK